MAEGTVAGRSATAPSSRPRLVASTVLAIGLAVWGQWALSTQQIALDGVVLFVIAWALFSLFVLPGVRLVSRPAARDVPSPASGAGIRSYSRRILVASLACVALAWSTSGGNRFRAETMVFWILAIAFYLRAFWEPPRGETGGLRESLARLTRADVALPWSVAGLAAVFALAAFFRYYQLAAVPAEMTSDHAEKLLDIRDLLNGQRPIFFPRNTGREPLQFYMAMPFAMTFGLSHMALKVLAATVSLFTVPLVYLIGREIGDHRLGLLAAFFLAVSMWDVAIGRVGLRFPYYPFFAALAFLFLLRALRRGSRNDYLLCGLATGVGLYGYSPFRAMLPLIVAASLVKIAYDRKLGREAVTRVVRDTAVCLGLAVVVLTPLAHYMIENPGMFWFRALTRVASAEVPAPPNPLVVLAGNVVNALLMFNWRGDVVWVNTIPGAPVLDYVSGGLFLLGVAWCLHALVRHHEPVAAYLLVGLFVLMLPSILSISFPGENPSVVRSGGATPIVSLLVAVPVYLTARTLQASWPGSGGKWIAGILIAVLLTAAASVNFERYFGDYANQYRQSARNSSEIASVISGFIRSVGSREGAYIKSWPHWVDTRNVAFNMGDPDWNNVLMSPEDITRHTPPSGNKLYIVNKDDREGVQRLRQRFPEGQLREQASATPGQQFLVFFVPGKP